YCSLADPNNWLIVSEAGVIFISSLSLSADSKHLHHLIPQVIDDFYRDAPGLWLFKWAGGVAVEGGPGVFVDFGFQRGFKRFVRVTGAEEVGLADEEGFFVVVGVDKPAGDAVGAVGADFASVGVEDVDAVDFDLVLVVVGGEYVDIRFA